MFRILSNRTFLTYALFCFSIFAILLWMNWGLILAPTIPSGDLAADMLLGNRIRDEGWLLVGHYSRYDFNHPGPFWFYYNHIIENLLQWSSLSRYHCWIIGSVIINTFLIAFSAFTFSTYLLNKPNVYFSMVFAFIFIGLLGGIITNIWMPNRLVCPFLAYFICLLPLSRGNYKYLSFSVLLAGTLIHGYLTMPFFTLPFFLLAIGLGYKHRQSVDVIKNQIRYSIIIIIIFALPFIFDLILNQPSNLARIFEAQAALSNAPTSSWQEIFVFINTFFLKNHLTLWLFILQIISLYPIIVSDNIELKKKIGVIYILCALVSLEVIFVYKHMPAPINPYVAQFFLTIPIVFIGATLSLYFDVHNPNTIKKLFRIVIFLVSIFILFSVHKPGKFNNTYQNSIKSFADALEKNNQNNETITLDFSDHALWPLMAGLLLELDNRHIKACTTDQTMLIIYTKKEICAQDTVAQFLITYSNKCQDICLAKRDTYAINRII